MTPAPKSTRGRRPAVNPAQALHAVPEIVIDRYRAFVFPNAMREQRRANGYRKLLPFSAALPQIPYIRLSKIERGEVFARTDELVRIAAVLGVPPTALLLDVTAADFDIAVWAESFGDGNPIDLGEERFAIMLGAALRALRNADKSFTIAALDKNFGLPPVILSRIENAQKTLDRWNDATIAALCRVFDVADRHALRHHVLTLYERGEIAAYLDIVATPAARLARTRDRIAALRAELGGTPGDVAEAAPPSAHHTDADGTAAAPPVIIPRLLPVFGAALPDGLIAATPTGGFIEAPQVAGPRAFGLRVCRPTLGGGLPGQATVIVDPDRYPQAGGLAALCEDTHYRLVTVTQDRNGAMRGYSIAPDREIALDDRDPATVAAVISALYV